MFANLTWKEDSVMGRQRCKVLEEKMKKVNEKIDSFVFCGKGITFNGVRESLSKKELQTIDEYYGFVLIPTYIPKKGN